MPRTADLESIALAFPLAATSSIFWLVPRAIWTRFEQPAIWGAYGIVLVMASVLALRLAGNRGVRRERVLFAVFLAAMPAIYVAEAVRNPSGSGWLALELGGLLVFVALAVLGLARSPRWLAIGILGHGLAWDAWHHGSIGHVPHWYAASCLLVDLGFGAYAAVRVRRWRSPPASME